MEPEPEHVGESAGTAAAEGRLAQLEAWVARTAAILEDPSRCDVVFVVAGERIPALRHLCAAHSPVFDTLMFGDAWRTSGEPGPDVIVEDVIQISGMAVTAEAFRCVLEWTHGARVTLTAATCTDVLQVSSGRNQ